MIKLDEKCKNKIGVAHLILKIRRITDHGNSRIKSLEAILA